MNLAGRLRVQAARHNPAAFASLCLRDEQTGAPVKLAPHHRAMLARWATVNRSVSLAPSEFGKSSAAAAYLAWRLGRDPSLRIMLVSGSREQASRLLRAVAIVMLNPTYPIVFPGRAIARHTQDELSVTGRPPTIKDSNILAVSYELSSALGARADLVFGDDVVNRDTTRSAAARDRAFLDFQSIVGSRIAPGGALHIVNTAEHSDDIPHRLGRLPGWVLDSYPALDEKGEPTWPERWPAERIEARRLELGPVGFRRAMLCQPVDAASAVFAEDLLLGALERGREQVCAQSAAGSKRRILACDPAWSTGQNSDESGIVLVAVDDFGGRHLTQVEGRRLNSDDLLDRLEFLAKLNRASVYIESNSGGQILIDQLKKRVPAVTGLVTSASSKAARVEFLASELAAGRWAFKNTLGIKNVELDKLGDELIGFAFEAHCGDRLSALLLATEAARRFEARPKGRVFDLRLFY